MKKNRPIGKVLRVSINEIKENPINYEIYSSNHSNEDEELKQSLELYGQLEPCLVNRKNNQLLSGHRRFNTLKKLGVETLDVIYKDVDELEVLELIQSNKHREKSAVEKVNEYRFLKNQMKSLPLKKRKELMSGMKLREYLHKEVGIDQTYTDRLRFIEDSKNQQLLNAVLVGEISIQSAYNSLKNEGKTSMKSHQIKKLKSLIKDYKSDFSLVEMYRIVDEVYKDNEE